MATIGSWAGAVTDIGPLYPFVGTEMLMVAAIGALWIAWHVIQLRAENREFEEDAARLREKDALKRTLDREG